MINNNEISHKLASIIELVNRQDRTEDTVAVSQFLAQAQKLIAAPQGAATADKLRTDRGVERATESTQAAATPGRLTAADSNETHKTQKRA